MTISIEINRRFQFFLTEDQEEVVRGALRSAKIHDSGRFDVSVESSGGTQLAAADGRVVES